VTGRSVVGKRVASRNGFIVGRRTRIQLEQSLPPLAQLLVASAPPDDEGGPLRGHRDPAARGQGFLASF